VGGPARRAARGDEGAHDLDDGRIDPCVASIDEIADVIVLLRNR
jgi:hypothetical protein